MSVGAEKKKIGQVQHPHVRRTLSKREVEGTSST